MPSVMPSPETLTIKDTKNILSSKKSENNLYHEVTQSCGSSSAWG